MNRIPMGDTVEIHTDMAATGGDTINIGGHVSTAGAMIRQSTTKGIIHSLSESSTVDIIWLLRLKNVNADKLCGAPI